jgi:hypothetical protein
LRAEKSEEKKDFSRIASLQTGSIHSQHIALPGNAKDALRLFFLGIVN